MKNKNANISIEDAIKWANSDELILKRRNSRFLLSDYQVNVLNNNGIDFNNFSNIHDLLLAIEECLGNCYDDELDLVGSQISELIYYNETKK